MFNVNSIIQMIQNGVNPQMLMMQMLQARGANTPFDQNLYQAAQNQDETGLMEIARNLSREKGLDFDTEFQKFRQQTGL